MLKRDKNEKIARTPIDIVVIEKKTNFTYHIELKYKTKKYEEKTITFIMSCNDAVCHDVEHKDYNYLCYWRLYCSREI